MAACGMHNLGSCRFQPLPGDDTGSSGVKEYARLRVRGVGTTAGEWLLVRTFPFVWFDGAKNSTTS